jgi:hypothetical protein
MDIASALGRKRDEIEAAITAFEAKIDAAREDLAAVDRALQLFDLEAGRVKAAGDFELERPLKGGESVAVRREALEPEDPLDAWRLARRAGRAEGLDDRDPGLFRLASRWVASALSAAGRRGLLAEGGKRNGLRLWKGKAAPGAPARGLDAEAPPRCATRAGEPAPEEFFYLNWP